MERKTVNEAEVRLAGELSELLQRGGHRAGALIVTRAPTSGAAGETRVLSAVGMRELNLETALDLVQLIKALRRVADDLDAQLAAHERPGPAGMLRVISNPAEASGTSPGEGREITVENLAGEPLTIVRECPDALPRFSSRAPGEQPWGLWEHDAIVGKPEGSQ